MTDLTRFSGQVVLITGAAGAIGSATAERFAVEGATVMLTDRNGEGLAVVESKLRSTGRSVSSIVADLSDEQSVQAMAVATMQQFGRIDSVAAVAGAGATRVPVHQVTAESWDRLIATNLRSAFLTLRTCASLMVERKHGGSIVLMSSSMALWDALDGGAAYAATKGAIVSLARAAAFDLARYRIRVNAVCPGVVDTALGVPPPQGGVVTPTVDQFAERIPLRRVARVEDIAATIAFLASSDASHVTGVGWLIDGGQTLQSWANAPA